MKLSEVTVEDVTSIRGVIHLLEKSTFSLSYSELAGAAPSQAWFQRLAQALSATYQAEQRALQEKPKEPGFAVKDYEPGTAPKAKK